MSGCYSCSSTERKCFQCQSPYGPDENGNCIPCTETQYWEDGICKENKEGCINQLSSNECISCSNDYYLLNKVCVKKDNKEIINKKARSLENKRFFALFKLRRHDDKKNL